MNCRIGAQLTTLRFGGTSFRQSPFGHQSWGSRVAAYTPTTEVQYGPHGAPTDGNLQSISAMPVYKDKSHEELRWVDYQVGDKGTLLKICQNSEILMLHTANNNK